MNNLAEGYTKLPNELFDWLILVAGQLTKRETACLLAIIRYTIGFNRESARLSNSFLAKATGIGEQHIPATLRKLAAAGHIEIQNEGGNKTKVIAFIGSLSGTPETGGEVLLKQEEKSSRNGRRGTPEIGGEVLLKQEVRHNKGHNNKNNTTETRSGDTPGGIEIPW
jgi:phage replication O-like protein O